MGARVRKLALAAHVMASVGWLGAVAAFLALAIAGLVRTDEATVRSAYVAMGLLAWWVITPLALAAFLGGLLQSLGTDWGLLRHHWVVAKLLITVVATLLLLLHLRPVAHLADAAAGPGIGAGHRPIQVQLLVDAALAAAGLVAATLLSIVKPRGVTRRGRRWQRQRAAVEPTVK